MFDSGFSHIFPRVQFLVYGKPKGGIGMVVAIDFALGIYTVYWGKQDNKRVYSYPYSSEVVLITERNKNDDGKRNSGGIRQAAIPEEPKVPLETNGQRPKGGKRWRGLFR